jgi:ElaB/YqjD/DUF883 family membrane-anchored ribosome-binding protein
MAESTVDNGSTGRAAEAVTGGVGRAKQQASEIADQAANKVNSARRPIADKLHGAASAVRDQADSMAAGEGVVGVAQSAADKLESSAAYIESHDARQMVNDLMAIVKKHPTQSLLIAGAFGFLVARALRND